MSTQEMRGQTTIEQFRKNKRAEFEKFRQDKKTEFEQFRQRMNEEYAEMLGKPWQQYDSEAAKQKQQSPKPVRPVAPENSNPTRPETIPVGKVIPAEKPIPDIPVTLPKVTPNISKVYPVNFKFFNTPCGIEQFATPNLNININSSSSVSSAWKTLTQQETFEPLLDECIRLREEMQLCDWGYLLLAEKVASVFYPKSPNNQALLATAILNQSGYDARLCNSNGKLVMMYHPSHTIYAIPSIQVDGKKYYLRRDKDNGGSITTYSGDFRPSPTPIRMMIDRYPKLKAKEGTQRVFSSNNWDEAPPFELTVNPSVIEFFANYPQVDWPLYGLAPVSDELKDKLFFVMKLITEGLNEVDAVNTILNFHTKGFKYMTDGDQFGVEKPFFFDENFYYPYNDCEDRAIMFAKIVKEVLNLDVVYLEFPRHLATAVRFSPGTVVNGASVKVDGETYVLCDPTCIGGRAGLTGVKFMNAKPIVHKISQ